MADISSSSTESASDPLTSREQEILVCLGEGLTNQEIANRLYLAEKTVRWYNSQIYSKLGVGSRQEAVVRAQTLGLLDTGSNAQLATGNYHLPTHATPFVGRRDELGELAVLLNDANTRLITVLAPGGMGKTRLALEAARLQAGSFADGVFFVPLAPLSSVGDVVTTIAENIGVSFHGDHPPAQQLSDFLRERSLLLVLDNFEHLLDAAPLIADLIQAAPWVQVLTTSRERLSLHGETVYALRGLDFPTWETPEDGLDYDAVNLFMQSARRARPDFELQAHDLDYLARICRLTGGMPLGIELAAGWIDVLSPEQIAAELQQGIDILETEMRDIPERQRSIRATFDRTWERLTDEEQCVFMRLSVFRGGFTIEAARAVADADVRSLRKLASKALLQTSPGERHDIHELLRQYGAQKLAASSENQEILANHSAYFLGFMVVRDEDVKGRRQQEALQEIRTDLENIRVAWLWAVEQQRTDLFHRDVFDCLVNFGEMCSLLLETQMLLQRTALLSANGIEDRVETIQDQANVRSERLNMLLTRPIAHETVQDILLRSRQRNDQHEIAYSLWVLGDHAIWKADYDNALAFYDECLALRRKLADSFYLAHTLVGCASVYVLRHQTERVLSCLYETMHIRRQINDWNNLCFTLTTLAWLLQGVGQYAEAEPLLDEALTLRDKIGTGSFFTATKAIKAALAFWRGEFDAARKHAQAGLDFAIGQDYVSTRNAAQAVLSFVESMQGNYKVARDLCQTTPTAVRRFRTAVFVYWGLSLASCELSPLEEAQGLLHQTLELAHNWLDWSTFKWLCLPLAAVLSMRVGQFERAAALLGLAFTAPQELLGWMAKWTLLSEVRSQLEAELGESGFKAAWERGQALNLEGVVTELLTELADE